MQSASKKKQRKWAYSRAVANVHFARLDNFVENRVTSSQLLLGIGHGGWMKVNVTFQTLEGVFPGLLLVRSIY